MVTITNDEWIANLGSMTCCNINTKMIVKFKESGNIFIGKIRDMPIEIMSKWAKQWYGERLIKNAVKEAEEVFLRAFIESDIEKNGIREEFLK